MLKERCPKCEGMHITLECDHCKGGWVDADENMKVYVNVYAVTREFGGYEEGGWYYDNLTCIDCVPCKNKYSDEIKEDLKEEYKHEKHGDISSVLGGVDIWVYIEDKPKKSETREKPIYE